MSKIITNSTSTPLKGRHLIHSKEGLTGCMFGKSNIVEGVGEKEGVVYLKGILQRADSRNQNGRVYPYNILKREVDKYDKTFIVEDRAYGELDHPNCLTPDTKVLTSTGWKYLKDIDNDESIITLNGETNEIETQQITEKIDQPYKGKMIRLYGQNIDITVTPNHRFWVINWNTEGKFVTAQDLMDGKIQSKDYYIPNIEANEINVEDIKYELLDYDGRVYCVRVPNQIFYARANGTSCWTGNSGVVELKTASHTVNKVWWNGKELWGLIELLNTPNGNIVKNIVKQGKNVGISSRGLGSYRDIDEDTVEIEEDFELIGWDIVSNPSTQRAFVYPTSLNENVSNGIPNINKILDSCYNKVDKTITDIINTF